MEQSKTIIRFSRSKNIEASANNAILALDEFQNIIGQPVLVRYYKDSAKTEVDAILAIGIKNGTGKESYKVVYSGNTRSIVNGVYQVPGFYPDVALLAHGEVYIVTNEEGQSCYCYAVNDRRYVDVITDGPRSYMNLGDNCVWFLDANGHIKCENDFYTQAEINALLEEKQDTLVSGVNIKTVNGYDLIGSGNIVIEGGGGGGTSSIFASGEAVDQTYLTSNSNDIIANGSKVPKAGAVYSAIQAGKDGLQEELISGVNIKTINYESLLGPGNITISGGGGDSDFASGEAVSEVYLSDNKSEITATSEKLFKGKAIYNFIDDRLGDIDAKLFPFSISASANPSPSSVFLSRTSTSTTITFSASKQKSDGSGSESVTADTTFYYAVNDGSWNQVEGNQVSLTGITGENTTRTYTFRGVNTKYGNYGDVTAGNSVSFEFGYRYLYGIVNDLNWVPNLSELTETENVMKSTSYTRAFTTTTTDYPVFCVPVTWGSVTKVVDKNGYDVTASFVKKAGTYVKTLDEVVQVTYYVYKKQTTGAASNFSYTFTIS